MNFSAGTIEQKVRLTSLAHGGGCGCKLSPGVLRDLLSSQPAAAGFKDLLVGTETSDDAAVWRINDQTCIIATTDFFMPIVDAPFDFGRIAATNALSDIYAMGGTPLFALAIVGMPIDKLAAPDIRAILDGGAAACLGAGIPIAGGHSIDSVEPIYGLAVIGSCHPDRLRKNSGAVAGDAVILTKALGVGIYSSAFKKGALSADQYDAMLASVTLLNSAGAELAKDDAVHAITDVTGFGLLGHGLEVARGSNLKMVVEEARLPFLDDAARLAQAGFVTGASHRNWTSYGANIILPPALPDWRRHLLSDPQTSGGLLVTCGAAEVDRIVASLTKRHPFARVIGRMEAKVDGESGFVEVV